MAEVDADLDAARYAAEHGIPAAPELDEFRKVQRERIPAPPADLMIPYPGDHGSGSAAGSATSKERQVNNDASGITSEVQRRVFAALGERKSEGLTALEVEFAMGVGHGMASSALSHLQRAGRIKRIKMRRKKHEIYVLPEWVNGREESPYRPRLKPAKHPRDVSEADFYAAAEQADVNLSFGEYRRLMGFLP